MFIFFILFFTFANNLARKLLRVRSPADHPLGHEEREEEAEPYSDVHLRPMMRACDRPEKNNSNSKCWQSVQGSFVAVSKPMFQTTIRLQMFFNII